MYYVGVTSDIHQDIENPSNRSSLTTNSGRNHVTATSLMNRARGQKNVSIAFGGHTTTCCVCSIFEDKCHAIVQDRLLPLFRLTSVCSKNGRWAVLASVLKCSWRAKSVSWSTRKKTFFLLRTMSFETKNGKNIFENACCLSKDMSLLGNSCFGTFLAVSLWYLARFLSRLSHALQQRRADCEHVHHVVTPWHPDG